MSDELDANIPAGEDIFFLEDIPKRTRVTTFFNDLAAELVTRGRIASVINGSANFDTRPTLIINDYREIELNILRKFQDTQVTRLFIIMSPEEEIEDYTKTREVLVDDPEGAITVQYWQREKLRVL